MERMVKERLIKSKSNLKSLNVRYIAIEIFLLVMCVILRRRAFSALFTMSMIVMLDWDIYADSAEYSEEVIMKNKLVDIILSGKYFLRHVFMYLAIHTIVIITIYFKPSTTLFSIIIIVATLLILEKWAQMLQRKFKNRIVK